MVFTILAMENVGFYWSVVAPPQSDGILRSNIWDGYAKTPGRGRSGQFT